MKEKDFYSKLSDDEKDAFIRDVLNCLECGNIKRCFDECYKIRKNRFLEHDYFERRRWMIEKIREKIAKRKELSHFWISYKE